MSALWEGSSGSGSEPDQDRPAAKEEVATPCIRAQALPGVIMNRVPIVYVKNKPKPKPKLNPKSARLKPPSLPAKIRVTSSRKAPPPVIVFPPPGSRPNRFVSIATFGTGTTTGMLAVDFDGRIWRKFSLFESAEWKLYDDTSV